MTDENKIVAARYSDFTIHKYEARKQRYITRHLKNEDWTKSGISTSGFWSKHLLWKLPPLVQVIKTLKKLVSKLSYIKKELLRFSLESAFLTR
jgi:hypothetical protein